MSFLLKNFQAVVTITESSTTPLPNTPPKITILPNPKHDKTTFNGLEDLYNHSHIHGYYGGVRLIQAACKLFAQRCLNNQNIKSTWLSRHTKDIEISYETDIPRMVTHLPYLNLLIGLSYSPYIIYVRWAYQAHRPLLSLLLEHS